MPQYIAKAFTLTGEKGDKRNSKYAAGSYLGAVGGTAAGGAIGARSAGTTMKQAKAGIKANQNSVIARTYRGQFPITADVKPVQGVKAIIRGKGAGAVAGTAIGLGAVGAARKMNRNNMAPVAKANSKKRSDEPKASAGRYVTGGLFPGFHGAIAGEKGDKRKLKAAGLELGGWFIGSALPGPGSVLGGAVGTHYAHKAGHYKKQNVSKSAFGVEHTVAKASGADLARMITSSIPGSRAVPVGGKAASGGRMFPTNARLDRVNLNKNPKTSKSSLKAGQNMGRGISSGMNRGYFGPKGV
jgi:hypothetical protein